MLAAWWWNAASAQTYPAKSIRLIVPYPTGGLDASSEQGSLRDANVRESDATAVLLAQVSTQRQQYPTKSIRLIVPYPPGGSNDNLARPLVQKLTEQLGVQVILENRGGGGALIGADGGFKGLKIRVVGGPPTEQIRAYVDDRVGWIELNRPEKHNAVSEDMFAALI